MAKKLNIAEIMKERRRIERDPVWRANAAAAIKELSETKGRRLGA